MTSSNIDKPVIIVFTDANISLIGDLVNDSIREGFYFVKKTLDEWNNGSNRFSKPGEQLWGILAADVLVGIGGLNHDPYTSEPNIGRVRHLYIKSSHRRKKYATALLDQIKEAARPAYHKLRLFTDNPDANIFYASAGFQQVKGYKVTHELTFDKAGDLSNF